MKIVVLDTDQAHNLRISTSLGTEAKTEVVFCKTTEELLEILSAKPVADSKKPAMEKTLADGIAMLNGTIAAIESAQKTVLDKKSEEVKLTTIAQEGQKTALASEISEIEQQIAKSESLKKKLETAIAVKQKEIAALASSSLTDEQKKVHIVLVDRAYLGNLPSDWILALRKAITLPANAEVPVVTMGYNEDLDYIKNTLHGGISDYFVKPVDLLLLKHNVNKISGNNTDTSGKVYEIKTKAEVKLLRTANVVKMSEFEIGLATETAFAISEVVELFAESLGLEKGQRLLACCTKVEANPEKAGSFLVSFSFVGHTPHSMNEMRKWLRLQYVALKQKGE